jgi:hypothetical protein
MNAALAQDDGVADVHLSLGARLASLTTAPTPVPDPTWSAADEIFGASVDIWCARADALWRDLRAPRSPEAETAAKTMELELAHLESRRMAELDVASLRQLAELTEALRGAPAARAVYEEVAARDDAVGHLGVGRMLLRDGDRRGLASIERAVELDRAAAGAAYALSHEFFSGMDQPSEAREYEQRFLAAYETAVADEGLRTALEPSDELVGHELDGDAARAFAEMLSRVRPVARAYLVRKIVPGRPDLDAHFLAIVYGKMWFLSTEAEKIAELSARVAQAAAELKPDITVVVVNRYAGRSKIEAVPGALIYRRAPESLGRQVVPRWARRIQNGIFVLSVCYALMYVYFVANIRPEFNAIAGPIVLAPIFAVVALLFWARRADDMSRRLAGLAGVSALMGVLVGAFLTEQEWTFVFVPALALGLLRPPAEAGSRRTAAVIAAAFVGALSVRILAHLVLIG